MDPFLGTIQAFACGYAPVGWSPCWGQILQISQYNVLYSLLSNTFGGDGRTTFALPDLRGRTILGLGAATTPPSIPGTSQVNWGQYGGSETVAVTASSMPIHIHQITNGNGANQTALVTTKVQTTNNDMESNESDNGANGLGTGGNMESIYRESPSGTDSIAGVNSSLTGTTAYGGGGVPAPIRNPYLGLYYCIATRGVYPPRP